METLCRMRYTPYSTPILTNPLFRRDMRTVRRAFWPEHIRRSTRRLILTTGLILLLLLGGLLAWEYISIPPQFIRSPYVSYVLPNMVVTLQRYSVFLLVLTILIAPLVDFVAMQSSVGGIGQEITHGRLDLLRLTPLAEADIAQAKHGIAQLCVWRITIVLMTIRFIASTLLLLSLFILPSLVYNRNWVLLTALPSLMLIVACIGLAWAMCVIEPLWRVRSVTALGLLISTYSSNFALNLLTGAGFILLMVLAQVCILSGYMFVSVNIFNLLVTPLARTTDSSLLVEFLGLAVILLAGVLLALIIRMFYLGIERWSVRRSARRIARLSLN